VHERILYCGDLFVVGECSCLPGDERWRTVNTIGRWALVAFPGTSVVIEQLGRERVLANPNHVMFYNPGQEYRRTLHDERGDRCVYIGLEPPLVEALVGRDELPFGHAPSDARAYVLARAAAHLLRDPAGDPLEIEELVFSALCRTGAAALAFHRLARQPARDHTLREHALLAETAKGFLTEHLTDRVTLGEVARAAHSSEFHLARIFREQTGFTLHRYRTHLRLRHALDRLAEDEVDLTALAAELGFSSHGHLTRAFKAVFGAPPSLVRSAFRLRELRRIVEAPLLAGA
jgi:AraC family transcriptional regulator